MQLTAILPYMTQDAIPELDINEIRHSEMIMKVFERVERIQAQIDVLHTEAPESRLGTVHRRLSSFPVAGYVHTQISVAAGCIAALKQMIVRETDDTATMTASPFGAYALIRNSIDAAAVGLWIAEPESSTGRIKRRLQAQVDETKNAAAFRQSTAALRRGCRHCRCSVFLGGDSSRVSGVHRSSRAVAACPPRLPRLVSRPLA